LPRIAVIMPAYNRAAVIGRAIESVLAQDLRDFELVVVDDGSTDGTADIVRSYRDPRLRLVEQRTNRGSNAARNAGIRASNAPLIAFLDSDDSYLPHKLSTVAGEFDRNPKLDALVDSFVKLCDAGRRIERVNPRIDCTEEFTRRLFSRELWKPTSAITVRRAAAIRAGLFDECVSRRQDMDFLIRLTQSADCASIDEILWVKNWSADGISAGNEFVASTLEIVRRHPQYIGNADYRCGLAKDLARHLLILLRERRYAQMAADGRLMVSEFGAKETSALVLEGTRELASRARKRRLKRRPGAPAEPGAPAWAKARRSA
jgi:glycosyltransferase involved in cell wall biosynthesis